MGFFKTVCLTVVFSIIFCFQLHSQAGMKFDQHVKNGDAILNNSIQIPYKSDGLFINGIRMISDNEVIVFYGIKQAGFISDYAATTVKSALIVDFTSDSIRKLDSQEFNAVKDTCLLPMNFRKTNKANAMAGLAGATLGGSKSSGVSSYYTFDLSLIDNSRKIPIVEAYTTAGSNKISYVELGIQADGTTYSIKLPKPFVTTYSNGITALIELVPVLSPDLGFMFIGPYLVNLPENKVYELISVNNTVNSMRAYISPDPSWKKIAVLYSIDSDLSLGICELNIE